MAQRWNSFSLVGALGLLGLAGWTTLAQSSEPATPPSVTSSPASTTPDPAPAVPRQRCDEEAENSCTELARQGKDGKERRIVLLRTGTSDDTGIDAICGPRDDEGDDAPTMLVLSETGPRGIEIAIDKNLIRVPLAIITKKTGSDGADDGHIEASAGTAKLLDAAPEGKTDRLSLCGVEVSPKPTPDTVLITQGKTSLKGKKLVYDEADGIAHIEGPITFKRENQDDPLSGKSDQIEVNVDDETTVLVGNVVMESKGGRMSKAGRVEYNDARNVAYLYATPEQPAESRKSNGEVLTTSNGYIYYNLEKNEVGVYTDGGIKGEFPDDDNTGK